ncbi:hypothetical protein LMG7974_01597 [Campylobacter majalis]|uniref:CopG family transcriptional regulator n=1 Tax=Campylobacter majalis TaxID=2790656 RepID=A0ABM8Q9J8_9BACT|nr:ribbon-helix-helix domain-containing protein [Campylobacter majalis]CAD7289520.1 hypothetical protein LMG7974_01597 [Campylobacter majalis]
MSENNPFKSKKTDKMANIQAQLSEEEQNFINKNVDEPIKKEKNKKIFINIAISEELKKTIEQYANSIDRSQQWVTRQALTEWFSDK